MKRTVWSFIVLVLLIAGASCGDKGGEKNEDVASSADGKSKTEQYQETYNNGQKKIAGKKVNGKRQGLWKSWYQDGKDWSQTNYRQGVPNGKTKTWYRNGYLRYTGYFANGARSGVWTFYSKQGTVVKRMDMDTVRSAPKELVR